jgi:hypothetical protein
MCPRLSDATCTDILVNNAEIAGPGVANGYLSRSTLCEQCRHGPPSACVLMNNSGMSSGRIEQLTHRNYPTGWKRGHTIEMVVRL